jgi:replicative DNA helicase
MSKIDVLTRLVGIMTKQQGLSILKSFPHDESEVADAIKKISESNMSVHGNKYDIDSIEFSMYEEQMKCPVDLFVVDFIQLISVKEARSEYETVTKAMLALQQTAKRLKVPIIVLSQISNEGAKSQSEATMSFKGSGSIGSAADFAIEIKIGEEKTEDWKTKLYKGEPVKMKWNVRKNRHGKVGYIDMMFTGATGIFSDPDDDFNQFSLIK